MKRLKAKIYEKNYEIKDIAKMFNISEQTITNWINKRNVSSLLTFLKITQFLDFTIEDYNKIINEYDN